MTKTPVFDFFSKLLKIFLEKDEMIYKDSLVISLQYEIDASSSTPESFSIITQTGYYKIFENDMHGVVWEIVTKEVVVTTVGDILND